MKTDPEYAERQRTLHREWSRRYRLLNPPPRQRAHDKYVLKNKGDGLSRVYFVQAASGPIKIGFTTKTPLARMAELQVGSHEKLTLLGSTLATVQQELELHRQFQHLMIRGEWFRPEQDLLSFITTASSAKTCPSGSSLLS